MKYLIAYKPCGCVGSFICEDPDRPGRLEDFRALYALYEREGAIVRESESPPLRKDCPHGSLPAQLAAKLREAEAREAGLKEWLQRRACAVEFARGIIGNTPLADQFQGKLEAFREVLTKLEGNGQWEGSKQ